MLDALKSWLNGAAASDTDDPESTEPVALATAALLLEVARADQGYGPDERAHLRELLRHRHALDDDALTRLESAAMAEVEGATDLQGFTARIRDACDADERIEILVNLWSMAFVDDNVDHWEEHIIRRIADLLHVRHRDFIHAKLQARESSSSNGSPEGV